MGAILRLFFSHRFKFSALFGSVFLAFFLFLPLAKATTLPSVLTDTTCNSASSSGTSLSYDRTDELKPFFNPDGSVGVALPFNETASDPVKFFHQNEDASCSISSYTGSVNGTATGGSKLLLRVKAYNPTSQDLTISFVSPNDPSFGGDDTFNIAGATHGVQLCINDLATTDFVCLDPIIFPIRITGDIFFQDPPLHNNVETKDFQTWPVQAIVYPNHVGDGATVEVDWGPTTAYGNQDLYNAADLVGEIGPGGLEHEFLIPKGSSMTPGTYHAKAVLTITSGQTMPTTEAIIETPDITISVIAGTATYFPKNWDGTLNSNGSPQVTCSQTDTVVKGLCEIFRYLFIPSQADFDQFTTIFDRVKNKPPFGYFVIAQSSLFAISPGTGTLTFSGISFF